MIIPRMGRETENRYIGRETENRYIGRKALFADLKSSFPSASSVTTAAAYPPSCPAKHLFFFVFLDNDVMLRMNITQGRKKFNLASIF